METLNPLQMPLTGLALIEASAGTGKTYTITTLYLRLLLQRGLGVDQILVVTFTEAATEELRDRIRKRVSQALTWLQDGVAAHADDDPTLAELLQGLSDPDAALILLADALTRMDEAAIYTIHGFCQRMLQDNAFDSGAAFDVEFITDEARLVDAAIEDFWRRRVATADWERAQWLRERWQTPGELLDVLRPTLSLDDLRVLPALDDEAIARGRAELETTLAQARDLWRDQGEEVTALLRDSPALNRRSYNKTIVAKAIAAAVELASGDGIPEALPTAFERLTATMLADKGAKAGKATPCHAFFDLCDRLHRQLTAFHAGTEAAFIWEARGFVRDSLARTKDDEGVLYFDDLLRGLDQALAGPQGEPLAGLIRRRFPVALVDEFQDTDPQQYRIFRRIYVGRDEASLLIIGDPKQAIYAFRGADIFTYIGARGDTASDTATGGRQYTLGTNYRSGSRLIHGINTLFGEARAPFIYEPDIHFDAVAPGPDADKKPLLVDGVEPTPLQWWLLALNDDNQTRRPPGYIATSKALDEAAEACAGAIAGLLIAADQGRATLGDRALRPGDIALLVRTHREGDLVQRALRDVGVNSVTLSQASVFDSDEALELGLLLDALADLDDEARVRAALAGALLGHDAAELDDLGNDDNAWEAVLERFRGYRRRWLERGFMVAFQELLTAEGITTRLLGCDDGERRLTNVLQLAELLQVASHQHPGIDGLLRWFGDQRAGDVRDEEQQLRLESDQGLVQVVTMHKSKGLEYPLVYIPFPWSYFKSRDKSAPPFFHDAEDHGACLDLGSADRDANRDLEQVEQLAERVRLLYVAVTRAARLCVLCWGKVNGIEGSAPAWLLHPDPDPDVFGSRMKGMSEDEIRADLEGLAKLQPDSILVRDLPEPDDARWRPAQPDRDSLAAAVFERRIDDRWRVSSYSALVRGDDGEQPDYDPSDPQRTATPALTPALDQDPPAGELAVPAPADPGGEALFDLPAGSRAGQFLHEIFEQIDFTEDGDQGLNAVVAAQLARYGGLSNADDPEHDWSATVVALVTGVLDTPLGGVDGLRLRDIPLADRLTELEFHFPIADLDPGRLRRALSASPDYADSVRGLGFAPLRGLMRGFIDLVFRYQGRFYIVDYKSNRLGRALADYDRAGMGRAIREHRYDLQYLIYSLALHRFLGRRLADYDYQRDFGGVYYLFLRGMRPAQGPAYGVWRDQPPLHTIAALDALFRGDKPEEGA